MGKALLVVALVAVVVYVAIRLLQKRGPGGSVRSRGTTRSPQSPPSRRVIGPDDDMDFLRDLEQKRRKERRERDGQQQPDQPDT